MSLESPKEHSHRNSAASGKVVVGSALAASDVDAGVVGVTCDYADFEVEASGPLLRIAGDVLD